MNDDEDEDGQRKLDEAYARLEKQVPDRVARAMRWLRAPESRLIRLPLGILCILLSLLWFLPVIGIELLPLGLLLIAQDVPFLKKPVANFLLWLERQWVNLRLWWSRRTR